MKTLSLLVLSVLLVPIAVNADQRRGGGQGFGGGRGQSHSGGGYPRGHSGGFNPGPQRSPYPKPYEARPVVRSEPVFNRGFQGNSSSPYPAPYGMHQPVYNDRFVGHGHGRTYYGSGGSPYPAPYPMYPIYRRDSPDYGEGWFPEPVRRVVYTPPAPPVEVVPVPAPPVQVVPAPCPPAVVVPTTRVRITIHNPQPHIRIIIR